MPYALRYITILLFLFYSCNSSQQGEKDKGMPIAKVFDKYLYESDIAGVGKGAAKPEDSVRAVKNYIDSWIRHNLILHYAEENLPESNEAFQKQLQDYKESLIIFLYEKALISQKLDTTVNEQTVTDYYNKYKDKFDLKTSVIKMRYVALPKLSRVKLDSAKSWLKKPNEISQSKLKNFCLEYAVKYSITDSTWFSIDEVLKILPLEQNGMQNAPYSKSFQTMTDSAYNYLVNFDDYKVKGSSAPINYVRNDIINLILNRRKLDYISQVHTNIYNDALEKKSFEIY